MKGTFLGIPYAAGSWPDKLIESFGGTHDFVGGKMSGLYDEQGNAKRGRGYLEKMMQETWSATGAIAVSTPFAMSEFMPPQLWQAIAIFVRAGK